MGVRGPAQIYTGDFNTHSPTWSSPFMTRSPWSHDLESWAAINLLDLLNTPGVPTRFGEGNQRDTAIDPAWMNVAAAQEDLFQDLIVDRDASFGSDHAALLVTYVSPSDFEPSTPPPRLGLAYTPDREDATVWGRADEPESGENRSRGNIT